MTQAINFFTSQEKESLKNAIEKAELNTSGEIRLHIENKCNENVLDRAAFLFEKLEMNKTELRNGVLFYLAISSRKFAILGDSGINAIVPEDFWETTRELMTSNFKEGKFINGLIEGIEKAGNELKTHFPYKRDDKNELSDDISFGSK